MYETKPMQLTRASVTDVLFATQNRMDGPHHRSPSDDGWALSRRSKKKEPSRMLRCRLKEPFSLKQVTVAINTHHHEEPFDFPLCSSCRFIGTGLHGRSCCQRTRQGTFFVVEAARDVSWKITSLTPLLLLIQTRQ